MAPAADDEGGLREEPLARQRKAVEPVLAKPNDREPTLPDSWSRPLKRLRLLMLGGTSEASALARRSPVSQGRADAVARRRDRQPCARADPAKDRRLRRRRRPCSPTSGRAHRRDDRRDPSFAARMSMNALAAAPRDRRPARRLQPPAMDARRLATAGSRSHDRRCGRALGGRERRCSSPGTAAARGLRAPPAASLRRAGDRPAGRDRRPSRLRTDPRPRAVRARRRTQAHARRAGRDAGDQEQRRKRDLRQDRGGADIGVGSSWCVGQSRRRRRRCMISTT